MSIIQTHSGQAFDLLHPDPAMINWQDIAVHLARDNRYHGATSWCEWSTAQHSTVACYYAHAEHRITDEKVLLAVLLHDAAEAYCRDLASPLRRAMRGEDGDSVYERIYRGVEEAVAEWAGLRFSDLFAPVVKEIDARMLATERELFISEPWIDSWPTLPAPYVTRAFLQPSPILSNLPTVLAGAIRADEARARAAAVWRPAIPVEAAIRFAKALGRLAPHLITGTDAVMPWFNVPEWAQC